MHRFNEQTNNVTILNKDDTGHCVTKVRWADVSIMANEQGEKQQKKYCVRKN